MRRCEGRWKPESERRNSRINKERGGGRPRGPRMGGRTAIKCTQTGGLQQVGVQVRQKSRIPVPVKRHRGSRDTYGTHTGHAGAQGHTDRTDEPHNHPNPPTHNPHDHATADSTRQQPQARSRPLPAYRYCSVPVYRVPLCALVSRVCPVCPGSPGVFLPVQFTALRVLDPSRHLCSLGEHLRSALACCLLACLLAGRPCSSQWLIRPLHANFFNCTSHMNSYE
jgi:hypothetical protein